MRGTMHSKRNHPPAAGAHRSAFTLTELLVIIAVVSVLAGMLLPALSNSKAAAKRIQCLGNLGQMALAAHVYVDDNAGSYPVAYYEVATNGVTYFYCWDMTTIIGASNTVIPGLLWQGRTILQIQQCPSFTGSADWFTDPDTGYNYNTSYIGHGQDESIPAPAKSSDVRRSSKTVLFGDGQFSQGADKFMRAPWPNPGDASFSGRWSGTQGFRHQRLSNAAFCDGHTASLANCYPTNADGAASVAPGTGFLSSDNSIYDLQ